VKETITLTVIGIQDALLKLVKECHDAAILSEPSEPSSRVDTAECDNGGQAMTKKEDVKSDFRTRICCSSAASALRGERIIKQIPDPDSNSNPDSIRNLDLRLLRD